MKLDLSIQEINLILASLGRMPYESVFGVIEKIQAQANVGIGTMFPSAQLELSTDSAKKPSTNTWTIASDSRLKTNIPIS